MTTEHVFQKIENLIPQAAKENKNVSKSTIGWQLDHTLKVMNAVYVNLQMNNPADYKPRFSFSKSMVLLTSYIPRGKVRAPKAVTPKSELISEEELQTMLQTTKESYTKALALSNEHFFIHPMLGHIRKEKAIKFAVIHSKHHLKIINDILQG